MITITAKIDGESIIIARARNVDRLDEPLRSAVKSKMLERLEARMHVLKKRLEHNGIDVEQLEREIDEKLGKGGGHR